MPTIAPSDNPVSMFGLDIQALTLEAAADRLVEWATTTHGSCRYVVTPNVDHLALLQQNDQLKAAYQDASLVVADGWPLVMASRLLRKPLPERVAGSDLVPAVFARGTSACPLRVFLLGAAPGVADRAAQRMHLNWPHVQVTGTCSPAVGFEHDPAQNRDILARIADAGADLLVIGLGAPKQELWIHQHGSQVHAAVAICAGATIDFLAGERQRAPRWAQKAGLEWCHRMLTDPRRLVRRYAYDAWVFPQLLWREMIRTPVA